MAPRRTPHLAEVQHVEWLTPHLIRIVLGGDGLAAFDAGEFTDHYVKLQMAKTRTYTVRHWDPGERLLTIDFVHHGDRGVAGPWAASAAPGDTLELVGPGGAYAPDPGADWHLMVGDTAVIPAIAASLERVPPGAPVRVVLAVDGPEDEMELSSSGDVQTTWIHGDDGGVLDAVAGLRFPAGRVQAFVHGEAGMVRAVRRHLLVERGVPPEDLSASGYWKRTRTEEGWREDKAEWKRQAEADLAAPAVSPSRA